MNVMDRYEETAFDLYLSEWPRDWDAEEILQAVEGDMNAYIVPWEPFVNWSGYRLAGEIESTIDLLRLRFNPKPTV